MKLNNKGFTLIELIVSIGLLSIIMVFMINLFMEARNMFNDSRNITTFESHKRYIIKTLNEDLSNYTIENVSQTDTKLELTFKEISTTKTLEILKENGNTYLFYGCKTNCSNEEKSISNYKELIPKGSVIGKIDFKNVNDTSKLGWVKIPIRIAGKREDLSVYFSYKEVDTFESYYLADRLLTLVKDSDENSPEVINKGTDSDTGCTQTFAYDGTSDNNLRYIGLNPCNYVAFNGESPRYESFYRIVNKQTGVDSEGARFDTYDDCHSAWAHEDGYNSSPYFECREFKEPIGGWRIIGMMNNVDDGTGKKESRIKLMRNEPLGTYSYDISESSTTAGYGINEWAQADIQKGLNTDYLNYDLTSNTNWSTFSYAGGNSYEQYDHTKGLTASAQRLIDNAVWHLGGIKNTYYTPVQDLYSIERGDSVWPAGSNSSTAVCNDGFCPRSTKWTGKVALPYPSDVLLAVGGPNRNVCLGKNIGEFHLLDLEDPTLNCDRNIWLSSNSNVMWTITPSSAYKERAILMSNNRATYLETGRPSLINPVVYLKSTVVTKGGTGSPKNPYVIS